MILPYTMDKAPKDGSCILLKYHVRHYVTMQGRFGSPEWKSVGTTWQQCFWDTGYSTTGPQDGVMMTIIGRWTPWCGSKRFTTTEVITHPIGWLPLPEEV